MRRFVLLGVAFGVVLAAGQGFWTEPKLVGTYPNWDYWWLNVRVGIDQFDTVYCAVARYNYSQSDAQHDLYVLNTEGDTVRVVRPWSGPENQPTVTDAAGDNVYIGQPLVSFATAPWYHMDAGVTDDSNCVSTVNSYSDVIYFTRLGPGGGRITWRNAIFTGNPWSGRASLARDPADRLHCTFADDIEHLVYGVSTDKGLTWEWDTLASQRVMSHVRVAATPDTCVHILYRTWTSGVQLRYLKLNPDGSVAVASSVFADGSERWCPNWAVDTAGNLRVAYIDGSQTAQNLYYTVLRGDADNGGQPLPDSELTLVDDTVIHNDPVRVGGPKICVDSENNAHIVFEQGPYGRNVTKYVYHMGQGAGQVVEEPVCPQYLPSVKVVPNPVRNTARISYYRRSAGFGRARVFDCAGRQVQTLVDGWLGKGPVKLRFDRGGLKPGTYFLLLEDFDVPEGVGFPLGHWDQYPLKAARHRVKLVVAD